MSESFRPQVNIKRLLERTLLETEMSGSNAQLRNFSLLRDRLVSSGRDATEMYRQIQARSDHLLAELKKLPPAPAAPVRRRNAGTSLLSSPLPPPILNPSNSPWFGYSGRVLVGSTDEGTNTVPQQSPQSGFIETIQFDDGGGITIGGVLREPYLDTSKPFDPSLNYCWEHTWNNLVLFPAPVVKSVLTYAFGVGFTDSDMYHPTGYVSLRMFAAVGEAPSFSGQEIVADAEGYFPYVIDLSPGEIPAFNNTNGVSNIQRSFVVEAGSFPAVALVRGVVSLQSEQSELSLDDGYLWGVGAPPPFPYGFGNVYFRYDPLPPESLQ